MKKLFLTVLAASLLSVSSPVLAQQAGAARLDGPYTSAAQAASHEAGRRERWRAWRRHHRHHRRHHWAH